MGGFRDIVLREIHQKEKDKCCLISHMWNLETKQIKTNLISEWNGVGVNEMNKGWPLLSGGQKQVFWWCSEYSTMQILKHNAEKYVVLQMSVNLIIFLKRENEALD